MRMATCIFVVCAVIASLVHAQESDVAGARSSAIESVGAGEPAVERQSPAIGADKSSVRPQDATVMPKRKVVKLSVSEAVRLSTLHNIDLRTSYYNHLIERTRISEAEAAFEPVYNVGASGGTNEVVFPQIFPTGQTNPDGSPIFQQIIVNDSTDVMNVNQSVGGALMSGATWNLAMNSDVRDREAGGLINPSFVTSTTLSVTQPVLRAAWLQYNQAAIVQARYGEGMSRQRFRSDVLATFFAAEQAYWELVFARDDLDVRKRALGVANRLLEISKVKVRTGVSAKIEVVSAESGVADRTTEVLVAANDIQERLDDLRRLILPFREVTAWGAEFIPVDKAAIPAVSLPPLEECIAIALKERPDLSEARMNLRSEAVSVAVADNEMLPRLDFTGSVSWTGVRDGLGDSFQGSFGDTGAESWNAGIQLEIPLGNKAARSRLSRARLTRDQAVASYRSTQVSAVEAVRRAFRSVDISLRTIASRRKFAELKQEELKNEQIKFDNRVSTGFQVLEVAQDVQEAESQHSRALIDYRIALAQLANSIGSTVEALGWGR